MHNDLKNTVRVAACISCQRQIVRFVVSTGSKNNGPTLRNIIDGHTFHVALNKAGETWCVPLDTVSMPQGEKHV